MASHGNFMLQGTKIYGKSW